MIKKINYPKTPEFWRSINLTAILLFPLAAIYNYLFQFKKYWATETRVKAPVICIGNVTLGGSGKTPIVQSLSTLIASTGVEVGILSRGYGGNIKDSIKVDANLHTAEMVGDEPLMLAQTHDVWIGRSRVISAQKAVASGKKTLIMDDGHQHLSLHKDLSFVVIDGSYGIGNGLVFPAGPMRELLKDSLMRADGVILVGDDETNIIPKLGNKKVIRVHVEADLSSFPPAYSKCVAFAGIGHPEKFFKMLRKMGYDIVEQRSYPDHYPLSKIEIEELIDLAGAKEAFLVTTEKDAIRLAPEYRQWVTACRIKIKWDDSDILAMILKKVGLELPGTN